jgi:predicted MPP superfamily phosphohydrolase
MAPLLRNGYDRVKAAPCGTVGPPENQLGNDFPILYFSKPPAADPRGGRVRGRPEEPAIDGWMRCMLFLESVLFAGACLGHTVLLIFGLNWLYGLPLPPKPQKVLRLLNGLTILAGPVALWSLTRGDLTNVLASPPGFDGQTLLAAYLSACWVVGLAVFPAVTLGRLLRRRPAALLSNHTQTVDVAARLGYKPVGHGKHRRLAWLPGNEVFHVDFPERLLCLPQLPAAWDGLTILHLSDLHLCGTPDRGFYRYVMDLCRDWEPDLVAVTGDIVDTNRHHRWIVPVLGRLRWRVAAFAILGNHDLWRDPPVIRRRLRRVGMHVLGNRWQQIEVRGVPLVVIGHEGPWFRPAPDLSGCPETGFRLCLSHTPDNIRWAQQHHVDLMLAGHVHGGQIRLPVIGSIFVPSRYSRRYDCGTFHEPPTLMHVSRGLAGQHPLRYNCRPEVTKIVLRGPEPKGQVPPSVATVHRAGQASPK